MIDVAVVFFAAVLTAGGPPAPADAPAPASLSFAADDPLTGSLYGIDAIDARASVYGERDGVDVAAGRHTVAYSCPSAVGRRDGARLTYDFEAGRAYELVCDAGQGAAIRPVDDC